MDYSHDSVASIYDGLTDFISLNQTVVTKDYLLEKIEGDTKVLVVGCGTGYIATKARQKGANVVAVDISKKMIERAKKHAVENEAHGITFVQKDFLNLEMEDEFDCIALPFFLNVFPDERTVERVLEKARSHLKPGGGILIADELEPMNKCYWFFINGIRLPVYFFFSVATGIKPHRIHDLKKIMSRLNIHIIEEKRFRFQYCSVLVGRTDKR